MIPTDKQRIEEIAKKWLKIGLSCEPLDRAEAAAVIREEYSYLGLPSPRIVFLGSPYQCHLTAENEAGELVSIAHAVWNRYHALHVSSRVAYPLEFRIDSEMRQWLFAFLDVANRISQQVKWDRPNCLISTVSCYTQAFRECCSELRLGSKDLTVLMNESSRMCRNLHWWLPYEKVAFVSERHRTLSFDSERQLHSETEMACAYPDGWGFYAWHGIIVPEDVILHPDTISTQEIVSEPNAEVRRVMIERMGWDRFCSEANMRVLHEDELYSNFPVVPISDYVEDGARFVYAYRAGRETAQLLESRDIKDFESRPLRFVRLTDPSTGRNYAIRVRHDHNRCYEAVGASFGMTEEEYKTGKYIRQGDVLLSPLSDGLTQQQHS